METETAGPANATLSDRDISDAQFKALANSIPNLAWMAHPDGWVFWYNQRWYDYTGTTPEQMAGWGWQSVHHPDVLPEMLQRWTRALESGEPFEMTFPLRRGSDGSFRIFMTRAEPLHENGEIVGWFGTNTDVTEQERTRERLQLVVNELNHRVKNTLATVQSIAMNSFRSAAPDAYETFERRLLSLASVHDLLTRESWKSAPLSELVRLSVATFPAERFDITGEELLLPPRIASALAMTLHELVTNAAKHGALSTALGWIAIRWQSERRGGRDLLRLSWSEACGPAVRRPEHEGFGLRLIRRAAAAESGASVEIDFDPAGLRCTIAIPVDSGATL